MLNYLKKMLMQPSLSVLMYHKVSEKRMDFLTVTTEQLDQHFEYLKSAGYQSITSSEVIKFIEKKEPLPPKSVLITFDDGYHNNLILAYPLLKKYHLKATIFLPTSFIGQSSSWDVIAEPLMNLEELRMIDTNVVEYALHSHKHLNYKYLTINQMREDLLENIAFFKQNNLPFSSVFAYPYGSRPKDKKTRLGMKQLMSELGIKTAFRIGNRTNFLPLNDCYEIQRVDIRGTETLEEYKKNIYFGKKYL